MGLSIDSLAVAIADTSILQGVTLTVQPGEIHAIMGPNGSGKSTLAHTLAGHPAYTITGGKITLDGNDMTQQSPDERANAGLFLAFQYPVEVAGVRVNNFLKVAYQQRFAEQPKKQFPTVLAFRKHVEALASELHVKKELLSRGLNEGFSGGEKKRLEILQMAVLEPTIAILDETDSGLDVDAIKAVASGVQTIRNKYNTGIVIITHYQRILDYIKPDYVHLMIKGKIVRSGDASFARELEQKGYGDYV